MPRYNIVLLTDQDAATPGAAVRRVYADLHDGAVFRVYEGGQDVRLPEGEIGDFHADGERAE